MAKAKYKKSAKSKKNYRGQKPAAAQAAPPAATRTPSASARAAAPARVTEPPSKEVDFRSEYRYVLSDLKRIGILAAAMFATLVVLALAIS